MSFQIQTLDPNWTSQHALICYSVSQWDREEWENYRQAFPDAQISVAQGEARIKGWTLFAEEVFHRLYTLPQPIAYAQIPPEGLWMHQLHQWLDAAVDFSELQLVCRNHALAAGEGTVQLLAHAIEQLPTPPRSFQSPTTVAQWQQQYDALSIQIAAFEQTQIRLQSERDQETDLDRQQQLQRQLDQLATDIAQLQRQQRSIKRQCRAVRRSTSAYLNTLAQQTAESWEAAIHSALTGVLGCLSALRVFGWGEGLGVLTCPGNADLKLAVAQRLRSDQRFQAIAQKAGRFQSVATLRRQKRSQQSQEELNRTGLGNDLTRLVPSEWVRFALDSLRFLHDYVADSLTQTEFDGTVAQQQGQMVICLDKSGSMNQNGGKAEIDSTALMLTLLSIAQEQGRTCRVILFDSAVRHVKDLRPQTATPAERVDLADRRYDGGTNFMEPLTQAKAAIESEPDLRGADVVFITDGQADVTKEFAQSWRQSQQRIGFKTYTLVVGTYIRPDLLNRFSDEAIFVKDLDDPQVHQLFDL